MTDATYARATMAYRASGLLIREPVGVAMALHQKLYAAVASARLADEQNRLDEMTRHVQSASTLLTALRFHLNFDAAGPAGEDLAAFYARLQRQIVSAAMMRRGNAAWDNVSSQIKSILTELSNVTSERNSSAGMS